MSMIWRVPAILVGGVIYAAMKIGGGGGSGGERSDRFTGNREAVQATVIDLRRDCNFTITETQSSGGRVSPLRRNYSQTGDCTQAPEFQAARTNFAGTEFRADGEATLTVAWEVPGEKQARAGQVNIDGRDELFYTVEQGAVITVYVNPDNPEDIMVR
jgi:hypothetical protein